ncbi:c-type cytochrome [Methylococcus capsulatus]|uniref:Conserved domain protein n=2 Tax=Methylococcus capsulatus TaxID=414 RepID=Q604Y4_METCA|nr:cytochrome c [Methylococcus capsulatus]AAU91531.1 conserved domain protein [Methylococcus capsulatus str. Bath]QXP87022.1 cytochrome c [Methylococcus capsulatus]QXP93298.1 cytochrome c [Methylococcus capsulatus]UQN12006.1 cytochrome c [Methylococcus capsulatus]CAI8833661.1 nitric oxide reductase subunit C [Methylococcus capsulatus]
MGTSPPVWASESFWKKVAIWVTAGSFVILVILTFDTLSKTAVGGSRVQSYSVINRSIDYRFDYILNRYRPVFGGDEPLFGRSLSEDEAAALVTQGKKTVQAKNCMNCHTLLGNGAYYAPDLTKAWLDPDWGSVEEREARMLAFLLDPEKNAVTFSSGRKMPRLGITDAEAHAIVAFLKWMSAIDTNGFPTNFKTIGHQED